MEKLQCHLSAANCAGSARNRRTQAQTAQPLRWAPTSPVTQVQPVQARTLRQYVNWSRLSQHPQVVSRSLLCPRCTATQFSSSILDPQLMVVCGCADLLKLAQKEKWQQCPKCRSMVERIEGCNYMVCPSTCLEFVPWHCSSGQGVESAHLLLATFIGADRQGTAINPMCCNRRPAHSVAAAQNFATSATFLLLFSSSSSSSSLSHTFPFHYFNFPWQVRQAVPEHRPFQLLYAAHRCCLHVWSCLCCHLAAVPLMLQLWFCQPHLTKPGWAYQACLKGCLCTSVQFGLLKAGPYARAPAHRPQLPLPQPALAHHPQLPQPQPRRRARRR